MAVPVAMMSGVSNPRAAQLEKSKVPRREVSTCDNCDEAGNFWNYEGNVACDQCLSFSPYKQHKDDKKKMLAILIDAFDSLFKGEVKTTDE